MVRSLEDKVEDFDTRSKVNKAKDRTVKATRDTKTGIRRTVNDLAYQLEAKTSDDA
jgi:hypothetical protein